MIDETNETSYLNGSSNCDRLCIILLDISTATLVVGIRNIDRHQYDSKVKYSNDCLHHVGMVV